MKVLLLGGTTEARRLAEAIAGRTDVAATLSLAGRTQRPLVAGLPTRHGGFGGVAGLTAYLRDEAIEAVVDATHPFAAQMSQHAVAACRDAGVALARLERAPWTPGPADRWIRVADLAGAATALANCGEHVLLTVGSHSLAPFEGVTGKTWLVRSIDAPDPPPAFARWTLVQSRGPFEVADEIELMRAHAIEVVVSKNSGAAATRAKIDAARALGLPVVMVERPAVAVPDAHFHTVDAALAWLTKRDGGHDAQPG